MKLFPPFVKVVMNSRQLCKSLNILLLFSFPSGLLDAYTEVPGTKEGMSDSDKFKEGYKKKGKGKVKNPPPKKVEEAAEEVEEVEDDGVGESWDDGVVESWDQIDVEEMPVPVKVKKEMRKEEKLL